MTNFAVCRDTAGNPLVAGAWYCIGFELFSMVDEPVIQYGPIFQFTGSEFVDEEGNAAMFFDPELQMAVASDAADAYARQG